MPTLPPLLSDEEYEANAHVSQHLLFHGFVMFQNECVGDLAYESTAAAISMAAAIITFLLDFIGTRLANRKSESGMSSPDLDSADAKERNQPFEGHDCGHVDSAFAAEESWRVVLLEAGIIFHSYVISRYNLFLNPASSIKVAGCD